MKAEDKVLFRTKFGSYLYGLDTPTSDIDFKTVYMPDIKSLILNKSSIHDSHRNKWIENEIECEDESMSIHKFLNLANQGQTMSIDMMWAPSNMWVETSDFWDNVIVPNRKKFITSSMNAFIGYATSQAVKYSNKGNRINNLTSFVDTLKEYKPHDILGEVLVDIKDKAIVKFIHPDQTNESVTLMEINGKKFNLTVTVKFVVECLEKEIKKYGNRAREAALNNGADWKAISHAFRTIYEVEELIKTGDIVFPLKDREKLLNIKLGKFSNVVDLIDELDDAVNKVKVLVNNSNYPKTPSADTEEMIYNLYRGMTV